jgi:hypothetical protein
MHEAVRAHAAQRIAPQQCATARRNCIREPHKQHEQHEGAARSGAFVVSRHRKEVTTMDSGMIGKLAKAHRYADEPERFRIARLEVAVHGDNSDHTVTLADARWHCDCEFFVTHRACAHTMALERVLNAMLPQSVRAAVA